MLAIMVVKISSYNLEKLVESVNNLTIKKIQIELEKSFKICPKKSRY